MSDIEILLCMAYVLGWLVVMVLMRKEGFVYAFFSGMLWLPVVAIAVPLWLFRVSKRLSNLTGW